MTDSPNPQHALHLLVPLVGLALTGCAWPLAGDASKPELNSKAWIEQRYEFAKGMLAGGHYGLALENFRDVLRYDRYSVKALNGLAASYDKLGRYDLAQRYYKKALVVEPTSFQTLNNIGYSYLLAGKYDDAREFLGKAAEIDGKNATVVANLKQLVAKEVAALSEKDAAKVSATENAPASDADNEKRMWIERSSSAVQVLITQPDSDLVEWANSNGIEPRWVHTESLEGTNSEKRITVLTERYPAKTAENGPSLTAAASPSSGLATGPMMTAATSPAVSGPEALPMSRPNAVADAAAGVVQNPAQEASTDKPSMSTATENPAPTSGTGDATAEDTAKTPEPLVEKPSTEVVGANPTPVSDPRNVAVAEGSVKAPAEAADRSSANSAKVANAPEPAEANAGGTDRTAPKSPVEKNPAVADRSDGKPLNLTPPKPTESSVAGTQVQSAGILSATDASEPQADATTNWIETPWRDPAAPEPTQEAVVAPAQDKADALPQAATSQASPSDSDKQAMAQPPNTDTDARKSDSETSKPVKGSDQLAALNPAGSDMSEYGPNQDSAKPRVLEISNGAGRLAMAARMEKHLNTLNIPLINLTNAMSYTNKKSVLYFKPGFEATAMRISLLLPLRPELRRNPALVPDLRLVLGGDMLDFDRQLIARQLVADSTP